MHHEGLGACNTSLCVDGDFVKDEAGARLPEGLSMHGGLEDLRLDRELLPKAVNHLHQWHAVGHGSLDVLKVIDDDLRAVVIFVDGHVTPLSGLKFVP